MNCSSKVERKKMYIKLAGVMNRYRWEEINRDGAHEGGQVVDEIGPKTSHYPILKIKPVKFREKVNSGYKDDGREKRKTARKYS